MGLKPTEEELAELLSEGLDLCVRAKKLDDDVSRAVAVGTPEGQEGTRCLTPALWVLDQYDTDLSDWQARARNTLTKWMAYR
ncbi:hypothetical protein [Phenylobacterium kunshanense]|uniref:Uncharacterized protein n=1 Tax=Phenylobacterium kunshanense TaxID=1445034 RepID=A0A328BN83_9CAUL|nr:hypothetical protein [Phenylobacterium kunshanense]RAK68842.1 hypothetical protein DJ019_02165 [Phenylobacterium kunshanense]